MLELLFNTYNLKEHLNNGGFQMYIHGSKWVYYYWFINTDSKEYTINIEYSSEFRSEISLLIDPGKYFPYANKDKIFIGCNDNKVVSILNRTYNRNIMELNSKKLPINWLEFLNMIQY